MAILIILLVLAAVYVLAMMGRTGHKGLPGLRGWKYAHRGLHGNGVPENSMQAFRLALEKGYGVEFDVHLMSDGSLAVIHDASLKRTAGADVTIEELTAQQLQDYCLEGTQERIPLFEDVLALFDGKVPLIIELKAEKGNHNALTEAVCKVLEGYNGSYCIESFDPRCLMWLRKNRPEIIRGQLAANFLRSKDSGQGAVLDFLLSNLLLNFLTRPDFVAYKFQDRKDPAPRLCAKLHRIQSVSWTLQSQQELDAAVEENALPIFEYFLP